MLLLAGPLVGNAFIAAVHLFAEASGSGGGPAALAQGLVAARRNPRPHVRRLRPRGRPALPLRRHPARGRRKTNGRRELLLQSPAGLATRLAVKGARSACSGCSRGFPASRPLVLWKLYGGHLWPAETANLLLGHALRFLLATGVAFAAAAVAEGAASAAIITLAFTLGTWALDFLAAGRGGLLERVARATPTAALRVFEHGELRASSTAALLAVAVGQRRVRRDLARTAPPATAAARRPGARPAPGPRRSSRPARRSGRAGTCRRTAATPSRGPTRRRSDASRRRSRSRSRSLRKTPASSTTSATS